MASIMLCFHCRSARKREFRIVSQEELETATSGFSPSALLGRGSHGSVFLAALDDGRFLTAAKLPTPYSSAANEIAVLSSLPASPFLVNIVGCATAAGDSVALVEFMPGGCLHDIIHCSSPRKALPFELRLRLALRVAKALSFLHALCPPVLHRDIKPSNILLDAGGCARLSDFGLAVRGLPSAASPAGTMGYLDPAYVFPADLSIKTDVYSFGVVLLELMSGRRAIDVEHSPASVVKWAVGLIDAGRFDVLWDPRGGRPGCAAENVVARDVACLAARCVGAAPDGRPSMKDVVACLRSAWRSVGCSGERKCWWWPATRRRVANVEAERWRPGD